MKEWTLVGIPLVITAVAALAKAEEGKGLKGSLWSTKYAPYPPFRARTLRIITHPTTNPPFPPPRRQNTQLTPQISTRGSAFLQTLYAQNLAPIFSSWGSHAPDFEWLERSIIYGLFLSDHSILNPVEAELVTLCSIMCQGLRAPTMWHLRGTRRLGVSREEVESVQGAVEAVARWAGRSTERWARVGDVEGEV